MKKFLAVLLCIIISVCGLFGGCDFFESIPEKPAEVVQPEGEEKPEEKPEEEEPPCAHVLIYCKRVNATCTENGTVARWECSECGKSFTRRDGETEIKNIVLEAKGHTFSAEYTHDETYHWHAATCGHSDEVKDKKVHTYNGDNECVCGVKNLICGQFGAGDFLKTDGKDVVTEGGEKVLLRGTNAGGLFVTEHWMTGFESGRTESDDYKSLTKKFIERFGEEKTKRLWEEYRANWWTDADFKACADMGMTVIRLPFTYMNVDFDAISSYENAGKNYDFTALDEFITRAAEYGLYTVLDLHGAYGSQNGQDHSGEIFDNAADVDFYYNEKMQALTVKLWGALSKHYKDNPAVAGYDILNEPGEKGGATSERHWKFYDKVYKAIRAEGDEHIIMFEACWEWYNLPAPAKYGWKNCIYSFHHYVDDKLSVAEHADNWEKKLSGIADQNFGLPLQMGEFTAYDSTKKWEQTLGLLNDGGWHYTSWTYKTWGNMSWGIVNVNGVKVDAAKDGYSEILAKFKKLRTEYGRKYSFKDSGATLEQILKDSLESAKLETQY